MNDKMKKKIEDNHLDCNTAVDYILYGLTNFGLIAEPYSTLINGFDVELTEQQQNCLKQAKDDLASHLILMAEQNLPDGKLT